jgi:hypothetical protein
MHMAAIAYNLKKYLKFIQKLVKSKAKATLYGFFAQKRVFEAILSLFKLPKFEGKLI